MYFVTLFKTSEGILLGANDEGIHARESLEERIKDLESEYNRFHRRSYEGSMSATLNWMQFQPSVVGFKDVDAIRRFLGDEPYHLVTASSVCGRITGIVCPPGSINMWKNGAKPRLISEET